MSFIALRCSECGHALYEANITHNLAKMANAAYLYDVVWRPEVLDIMYPEHMICFLERGIKRLIDDPIRFKKLNPSNGFGTYEDLLQFMIDYLEACKKNPTASIEVSR